MSSINILEYAIKSAQGDLSSTIDAIKNDAINISSKSVETADEKVQIPYFAFDEEMGVDQEAITTAIKELVIELLAKLTTAQKSKTALIIGTSMVDLNLVSSVESTMYQQEKFKTNKSSIDSYAQNIAKELGLNEFTMTISTACTSSINALLEAKNLINAGVVEYAVVVGVELFTPIMSSGFYSMKLLSMTTQKPFDIDRDGFILGEGIAGVLVSKEQAPWSLKGGYSNCNAVSITSVNANGEEYAEVMQEAMSSANITGEQITAIKAQATSSVTDEAEINAIAQLFTPLPFTALKPYIGHTLGACGILEMAIFMACIDRGFIPKTKNHTESILENYSPILEHTKCSHGDFMLNYFGFGGNNTSVIIEKEKS